MRMMNTLSAIALSVAMIPAVANAQASGDIRVEVVHGGNTDLSLTPVWFGFHNGDFDTFTSGEAASAAVEAIAEVGVVGPISDAFTAAPGIPGDIQGVALAGAPMTSNPPPIQPGETGLGFVTPVNPSSYQYFSFLSMIVPTNDTFIGNGDPLAHRVFNDLDQLIDEAGNPTSVREIEIFRFYDAGTEVDGGIGAAFQSGANGADGVDQNGLISLNPDLSTFLGTTDATGLDINDIITPGELIATIRISQVPEPGTLVLAGLAGLGLAFRRR